MNIDALFNSLDHNEKIQLEQVVRNWNLSIAEEEASKIFLTKDEKYFVNLGKKLDAIKSIKDRKNCTILTAKIAIDNYIEDLCLESMGRKLKI